MKGNGDRKPVEVWKFNRQVPVVAAGALLRIQAGAPFLLRWTNDEWQHAADMKSNATEIGIHFVDISVCEEQRSPIRFTFLWTAEHRWEGRDYLVKVEASNSDLQADSRRCDMKSNVQLVFG